MPVVLLLMIDVAGGAYVGVWDWIPLMSLVVRSAMNLDTVRGRRGTIDIAADAKPHVTVNNASDSGVARRWCRHACTSAAVGPAHQGIQQGRVPLFSRTFSGSRRRRPHTMRDMEKGSSQGMCRMDVEATSSPRQAPGENPEGRS